MVCFSHEDSRRFDFLIPRKCGFFPISFLKFTPVATTSDQTSNVFLSAPKSTRIYS